MLTLPAINERCLVLVAGRASINTPSRSLTILAAEMDEPV